MSASYIKSFLFIIAVLIIGLSACGDDDEDMVMEVDTEELLIGTWMTDEVNVVTMVDGQSVADYLVNVVGLSTSEAAALDAMLTSYLESELTVTLTFYDDHTYESMFSGGMDSGTWSLSADEKTITIVEGGEVSVYTIESISETTMNVSIAAGVPYDIDDDPNTPDVTVDAEAHFTLVK